MRDENTPEAPGGAVSGAGGDVGRRAAFGDRIIEWLGDENTDRPQPSLMAAFAGIGGLMLAVALMGAIASCGNKPRYPNLPSIMKAKTKPFETVALAAILGGADARTRQTVAYKLPPERGPVKMITGADAAKSLVGALKDEAKAL